MDYDQAVKIWAADKLHIDPDKVKSVTIGTGYGGYCETCEYTFTCAEVYTGNSYEQISIDSYTLPELLKEILDTSKENTK